LHPRCYDPHRRRTEYTADKAVCQACALRAQCTRARNGGPRRLKRHDEHEAVEAGRRQAHSRAAKRDRVRRRYLLESSFADAANNHGFKRARWRGLLSQCIQDYLIASIQNVRILLTHGVGRRRAAAAMRQVGGTPSKSNRTRTGRLEFSTFHHLIIVILVCFSPWKSGHARTVVVCT
jgi:hypothetical protein